MLSDLRWLSVDWDEGPDVGGPAGPYRQSERMADFVAVTERFLEEGRAYHCYCTPEELEDRRRAALKRGETPGYDGRCRNLTDVARLAMIGSSATSCFSVFIRSCNSAAYRSRSVTVAIIWLRLHEPGHDNDPNVSNDPNGYHRLWSSSNRSTPRSVVFSGRRSASSASRSRDPRSRDTCASYMGRSSGAA